MTTECHAKSILIPGTECRHYLQTQVIAVNVCRNGALTAVYLAEIALICINRVTRQEQVTYGEVDQMWKCPYWKTRMSQVEHPSQPL